MSTSTLATVNPRYFLNRLALSHSRDTLSLDPVTVIVRLLSKRSSGQMTEMLENFCEAAVAPALCRQNTPAELLCYTEDLEQLIEASYLLYRNRKTDSAESSKPLKDFFHTFSLQDWKRILHQWLQAAMSPQSIAELGDPFEMIPFVKGMEELIKVAAFVAEQHAPI